MFGSKFHPLRIMSGAAGHDIYNGGGGGKGGGSAPAAPDFTKLARETAKGNLDLAKYTTAANRINQVTPYGTLNYSTKQNFDQEAYNNALADYNALSKKEQKKATAPKMSDYRRETWTATQELTPEQQGLLEQTQGLSKSKLGYAQNLIDEAAAGKGGIDLSTLPSLGINPGETYSDAIMRRLQPQQDQARQSFESQMANRGVVPGTEAYNNAYRNFEQAQNDLLTSAIVQGGQYGLNAREQAYNQALQNLNQPINMINSLQYGTQVQNPNYVNSANMPQVQGPDLLGAGQAQYQAAMNQYNADQASSGGFFGGLMQAGNLGLNAYRTYQGY